MRNVIPSVHLLGLVAVYGLTLWLGSVLSNQIAWVILAIPLGFLLCSQYVLVHETTHGNFFTSKLANRIVGLFAAALTLDLWTYYRSWHYDHHMALGEAGDSEEDFVFKSEQDYWWQFVTYIPQQHNVEAYFFSPKDAHWKKFVAKRKMSVVLDVLVLFSWVVFVIYGLIVTFDLTFFGYVLPLLVSMKFLFVTDVAEHYNIRYSEDVFSATRTVESGFLTQFVLLAANFHTAHHAFHTLPYYALKSKTREIKNQIANYEPSYLRFHQTILQQLRYNADINA